MTSGLPSRVTPSGIPQMLSPKRVHKSLHLTRKDDVEYAQVELKVEEKGKTQE